MRCARVVVTALVIAGASGCASGGGSTNVAGDVASGAASTTRTRRNPDVIDANEISTRATDAATALQIIQKLRPRMLQSRGLNSPNDPTGETTLPRVYVDNVSFGDVGTLSNLAATQILTIQFLNARDATTRFGTGHMGGVILVTTKR